MKQITFEIETQNTDGSPITGSLTFALYIDTVTPPVKKYPVPDANVAAAVLNSVTGRKVVTVLPADIGLTPIPGTKYYVDATETSGTGTSDPSAIAVYTEPARPKAPANLAVS